MIDSDRIEPKDDDAADAHYALPICPECGEEILEAKACPDCDLPPDEEVEQGEE